MYACAGGHEEVVRTLLDAGANVEDHNENGHTPLMEAASAGHVGVAKVNYVRSFFYNPTSYDVFTCCYSGTMQECKFKRKDFVYCQCKIDSH
jgi:ankyrin repeat domain-containing protein 17